MFFHGIIIQGAHPAPLFSQERIFRMPQRSRELFGICFKGFENYNTRPLATLSTAKGLFIFTHMQTPNDFFVTHRWMGDVLGLQKADRTVFAILWGFCQGGNTYSGRASYIADLAEITRSTLYLTYSKLEELEYIQRYGEPTEIALTKKVFDLINGAGIQLKVSENRTGGVRKSDKGCPKIGREVSENRTAIIRNSNKEYNNTNNKIVVVEAEQVKPTSLPPHRVAAKPLPEFSATTTAQKLSILKEQANGFYKTLIADDIQTELLRKNNRVGNHPLTMEQLKFHLNRFCKYKVETAQKGWHRYDDFRHNFSLYLPTSIARAKEEGGAVYVRPETPTFKRPNTQP